MAQYRSETERLEFENWRLQLDHRQAGCPSSPQRYHLIDWSPAAQAAATHETGTCLYCLEVFITRKAHR